MKQLYDLLSLSQIPGIGSNRLRTLIAHFGDTQSLLNASIKEISLVNGFDKKLSSMIYQYIRGPQFKNAERYAEQQLSKINKMNVKIITYWDKQYPELLKKIFDPPTFLFIDGDLREGDKYSVAIVGTRTPSDYGMRMAEVFAEGLAKLGLTVVSGLARGIDTITHSTTLKYSGRTLAVIGSGLDIIYPPENKSLSKKISSNGAIITEYPMGTKPDAQNFPKRNRIISGMSLGTLVVETDIDGGAMITASTALDQNREVFAIPGNINSKRSRGCNHLIKEGRAKLVETIDDILDELSYRLKPVLKSTKQTTQKPEPEVTVFEKIILDVLSENPSHIDSITESTKLSTTDVLVNLLSLEFKGLVKQLPGKMFIRI